MKIDTSQFAAIGHDIARNAGRVGLEAALAFRKTIHDMEADAKDEVRVDTGTLKNSISSEITGDGRFGSMVGEVGPTVDYGIWQEIGTSKMAGHPYLVPAFERRVPPFIDALAHRGAELL